MEISQWTGRDACERVCPRTDLHEEKPIYMLVMDGLGGDRWSSEFAFPVRLPPFHSETEVW